MITLQTPDDNIKYFINTIDTILYIYDIEQEDIELIYSTDFKAMTLPVIEKTKTNETRKFMSIRDIIKEDNDFVVSSKIIASTIEPGGNFIDCHPSTRMRTNYLNIYLNSRIFQDAATNNHYSITCEENLIELLEDEAPAIFRLLKNLFHGESDEVLINYLNYLNVISFTDKRQDILWLFKGTSEKKEGAGAGKGVLKELYFKMFSGLVCSVSNTSYNAQFNNELLNKKVVIFDELDFKALRYSVLKDITGSSTMRVESKGKEALIVPNVSSWHIFTNENDLKNKIKMYDRRTFIIEPNPVNESLISFVIDPHYGGDFDYFEECLHNEIENFIHIISLATGRVKTPIKLKTEAHKRYFSDDNYSLTDINQFNDIFLNNSSKKKFIDFLEELKGLKDISEKQFERIKFYLNTDFYYQNIFEEVFSICQQHQVANIKSRDKSRVIIKALKDELLKDDHVLYNLDTSFTYQKEKRRIKHSSCIRVKNTTKEAQKEINKQIKSFYIQNLAA